MLLDSNVFIYAPQPEYASLREWCMDQDIRTFDINHTSPTKEHVVSRCCYCCHCNGTQSTISHQEPKRF